MRIVTLDFETRFGDDYSLSQLTTEAYVRSPLFKAHGAAVKWSEATSAVWYDEKELRYRLAQEDWSDVFLLCHHIQFDGFILSQHYNVVPKMYGCTLSCSRLLLGNHLSVSLDAVRKHYGMPGKLTPYQAFKNKSWEELTPQVQAMLAEGACDEVESIYALFKRFIREGFPRDELEVIDSVARMFCNPVLELDTSMLAQLWESEEIKKTTAQQLLGITAADLQSSARFCELLEERGVEIEYKGGKNGPIPAIAKNDPFMRDFLREHDDETIRALAEARIAEKSTLLQTRAATLGWVASRGPAPVYLRYSGAGTLRPSGGDGCNWLNFKRGSPIRRAIKAPQGHYLAPVDASQIECRVLHYLAGGADDEVVIKFRNNEDPYVDLASHFYQEQIYKPEKDDPRKAEMEAKRGMGKQGRLMCLGYDTKVLTPRGWIAIIDVLNSDLLWDGVEWVKHQGLISQGEQNVVKIAGVQMTSDHRVLCGASGWLPAAECLRDESILSLALVAGSANLPLRAMNWEAKAASPKSLFDVLAGRLNIPLIRQIFTPAGQRVVLDALAKQPVFGSRNITATRLFARIKNIALACSDASALFLLAVNHQIITHIIDMEGVALKCTVLGGKIEKNSWPIWSNYRAGTFQLWNWIAKTMTDTTRLEISGLLREALTGRTNEQLQNLKQKIPTYDLSYAGPKNRFMIFSEAGPLIVHNCGYGASGKQFKATAASGQYGPRVDMTIEEADSFVALYRRENQPVTARNTGYWAQCERMLARLGGGDPIDYGPLHVENHRIYIQGAPMIYDTIEYHTPAPDEENPKTGWRVKTRQGWKFMWGSKLTQNICEGVSRMIVSQAMIRIKKKYGIRTLNWPYDELLLLIPKNGREEEMLQLCIAEMVAEPSWLPGIPLAAEGALGSRYEK